MAFGCGQRCRSTDDGSAVAPTLVRVTRTTLVRAAPSPVATYVPRLAKQLAKWATIAVVVTAAACSSQAATNAVATEVPTQTSATPAEVGVDAVPAPATESPTPKPTTEPTPSSEAASLTTPTVAEQAPTPRPEPTAPPTPVRLPCDFVQGESASIGELEAQVDVVASGLEVPWGVQFLPGGEILFTERPGRLRLIEDDQLVDEPVLEVEIAQIDVSFGSEGGLLGVLLHPEFADNRLFYLYLTATTDSGEIVNRLLRYNLALDLRSAEFESVVLDNIAAGGHHQGGRMAIGPDGKLYVGVGAFEPIQAQDPDALPGKLLRMELDGSIPSDNPSPDSYVFMSGIRNSQGFDWFDEDYLLVMDHGPSAQVGSSGLRGLDEFNVATAGSNLGWADIWGCDAADGLTTPVVVWEEAIAPGGAAMYRGEAFPRWTGSFLVATLGLSNAGQHLQRIKLDPLNPYRVLERERFLVGEHGRLRTVAIGRDGLIYVTTSNCDGRGFCPPDGDLILRISPGSG